MMKTLLKLFGIAFALASCSSHFREGDYMCPNVQIPQATSFMTQIAGYSDELKIEIIGYEGYCLNANNVNRRYAAIRPIFRIQRLSQGHDSRVDVSYFTETIQGPPEYLGRRNYFASFNIPLDVNEKQFKGGEVRVRIPNSGYNDFAILLGMNRPSFEYNPIQSSYDVEYRYLSSGEIEKYDRPLESQSIDVSSKKSGCGCGL